MSVRGLNLEDVSSIIKLHYDDAVYLFQIWKDAQSEIFSNLAQREFLLKLVSEAPITAANIIAHGADAVGQTDKIRVLPLAVQLEALNEIVRFTMEDAGGPKGFTALLMRMIENFQVEK